MQTSAESLATVPISAPKTIAWWKKAVAGLALATVSFVGFMGFLHTKPGLPLRAIIFGTSCPVGNFDAKELEPQIAAAAAQSRGTGIAPSREHAGFTLGKTTLADAEAWAKAKGVTCERKRQDSVLYCETVAPSAIGRPESDGSAEMSFLFRIEDKTLYNFEVYHMTSTALVASIVYARVAEDWRKTLGKATQDTTAGKAITNETSALVQFAYSDAVYELSYMNLGGHVVLKEHVMRPDLGAKP